MQYISPIFKIVSLKESKSRWKNSFQCGLILTICSLIRSFTVVTLQRTVFLFFSALQISSRLLLLWRHQDDLSREPARQGLRRNVTFHRARLRRQDHAAASGRPGLELRIPRQLLARRLRNDFASIRFALHHHLLSSFGWERVWSSYKPPSPSLSLKRCLDEHSQARKYFTINVVIVSVVDVVVFVG